MFESFKQKKSNSITIQRMNEYIEELHNEIINLEKTKNNLMIDIDVLNSRYETLNDIGSLLDKKKELEKSIEDLMLKEKEEKITLGILEDLSNLYNRKMELIRSTKESEIKLNNQKRELEELSKKLNLSTDIEELINKKNEFIKENEKNKNIPTYPPNKLLVIGFDTDAEETSIDVFVESEELEYKFANINGYKYISVGGNRTVTFDSSFQKEYPFLKGNTTPLAFITFKEACLLINSEVYLHSKLTPLEIHNVLTKFTNKYTIKITDDDYYMFKEKGKSLKK